nr:unnamed protein product [Callosobruchus chinensis]
MAHEHRADVLIISEQYKNSNGRNWFSDRTGTAAIWVRNSESLHISKSGEGDGFVWVRINNITFISCYFSPNEGMEVFHRKMECLEDAIRELDGELMIAGDLNAKAPD